MMKHKGRWSLFICLVLLGGFTFFDYLQDQKKEETKMQDSRVMTLNYEQVNSFTIQKREQKIVLNRTTDGWDVLEPLKDQGDNTAADDFVKNVFPERVVDVAAEGEKIDWRLYGLDHPAGVITFKTTDGKSNVFEISEKRNFEDNVFVRRDKENKVLVVNSIWQTRLNKKVLDFRDRRVFKHKIASVDRVSVKNEHDTVDIQRVNGQWVSSGKKNFKIDQNKVRELLSLIADAKASEILEGENKPPVLKSLFTMDLKMETKFWRVEVGQAKDFGIFAKVIDRQENLKLESGALDKVISMKWTDLQEAAPTEKKEK